MEWPNRFYEEKERLGVSREQYYWGYSKTVEKEDRLHERIYKDSVCIWVYLGRVGT
jgi:hypothetical protein